MSQETIADPSAIAGSSFYGMLTAAERSRLERMASSSRFSDPGYLMMLEGQQATHVTVLLRGLAKATFITAVGGEAILRIYGPGDLLGTEAILGNQERSESVTALARCHSMMIPPDQFADLLSRDHGIARAFSLIMLQRARAADQQAKNRFASPATRLARALIDLAERVGVEVTEGITIPVELSQEELASWIGTSRSTVARMLSSWRHQDLIRTGYRRITITDSEWLQKTADTSP